MEPLRKPRYTARNTRIRKRSPISQLPGLPLVLAIVITIVFWMNKDRTIGVFTATGIAGVAAVLLLFPNVKTFLTRRLGVAGLVVAIVWGAVSLGLCISFLRTAAEYTSHSITWRQNASTELRRTFLSAAVFGTCMIGRKALGIAIRRKGRSSC